MSKHAIDNAHGWLAEIKRMVAALDTGDDDAREAVLREIEQAPLEVCVRSNWRSVWSKPEAPDEYYILLTTGGPALRIRGALNQYGEPETARLQWQDWGTPWYDHLDVNDDDVLLAFARCFYFVSE